MQQISSQALLQSNAEQQLRHANGKTWTIKNHSTKSRCTAAVAHDYSLALDMETWLHELDSNNRTGAGCGKAGRHCVVVEFGPHVPKSWENKFHAHNKVQLQLHIL